MSAAGGASVRVAGGGAVTAVGRGLPALLEAVFAGRRGVRPLERLAGIDALTEVAAELPAELLRAYGDLAGLPLALAVDAAEQALAAAGVAPRDAADVAPRTRAKAIAGARTDAAANPERDALGLVLACAKGDLSGIDPATDDGEGGLGIPRRLLDPLAEALGLGGPRAAVSCACASGLSALALAGRWIECGHVRRALVVGVDVLTPFILRGFSALLALDPGPCRPFDRERRGLNLGEAAGAMLLERADGDAPGPRLTGWGEANDANHVTGPSRDGAGLARAMRRALARAGRAPDDVDVLHLHGTGTPYNDAMEARAAEAVFDGRQPAAFGSKAVTGHTLGAAGLLESLVLLEALRRGRTPPQPGFVAPDDGCPLSLSPDGVELPRARRGLKLAAGFGGIDAALLFEVEP